jgi:lysophospholipase L1-like esterase/dienelactone hydrolase
MFTLQSSKTALIALFACFTSLVFAQKSERYKTEVFSKIDSIKEVQYGEAVNVNGESEKLLLNILLPISDTLKKRPLIVAIHGGGFVNGDKAGGFQVSFCKNLTKKGYVTASINYRMGIGKPKSDVTYFEAMYRAVQDAKAAVRFFRKNAETYGIDTSKIFIMGGSAGSMTALHVAYLDQKEVPSNIDTRKLGSLEGTSGNAGFSSKVHGVINCWGAMVDYKWINTGDVPLFSVHGTGDSTVPYDDSYNYHGFAYGSQILYERALSLGIPTGLKLFEKAGHNIGSPNQKVALEEITLWLFKQLQKPSSEGILKYEKDILEFEKLDKTETYSPNAILFTGSSYIRLWKTIKQDLAPNDIIHRGFGGSNVSEMAYYISRITHPHPCKAIFFYTGSNDITGGTNDKSPTQVLETFKYVVKTVRKKFPSTPIYWIQISPNERRWAVWNKISEANELLKNYCETTPNLHYVETASKLLDKNGSYQTELYRDDKLHFNEKGYQIWTEVINDVIKSIK